MTISRKDMPNVSQPGRATRGQTGNRGEDEGKAGVFAQMLNVEVDRGIRKKRAGEMAPPSPGRTKGPEGANVANAADAVTVALAHVRGQTELRLPAEKLRDVGIDPRLLMAEMGTHHMEASIEDTGTPEARKLAMMKRSNALMKMKLAALRSARTEIAGQTAGTQAAQTRADAVRDAGGGNEANAALRQPLTGHTRADAAANARSAQSAEQAGGREAKPSTDKQATDKPSTDKQATDTVRSSKAHVVMARRSTRGQSSSAARAGRHNDVAEQLTPGEKMAKAFQAVVQRVKGQAHSAVRMSRAPAQAVVAAQVEAELKRATVEGSRTAGVTADAIATAMGEAQVQPTLQAAAPTTIEAPVATRDAAALAERVLAQVDQMVLRSGRMRQTVNLVLQDMGRLTVDVKMTAGGELHVMMQASEAQTAALLERGLGGLAEGLRSRGYADAVVEVRTADGAEAEGREGTGKQTGQETQAEDDEALAAALGRRYRDKANGSQTPGSDLDKEENR